MEPRELCIKCSRNKPSDDETWFCKSCKDKIINYCWNYHKKLQENY
jgi:hypothetical protein